MAVIIAKYWREDKRSDRVGGKKKKRRAVVTGYFGTRYCKRIVGVLGYLQ